MIRNLYSSLAIMMLSSLAACIALMLPPEALGKAEDGVPVLLTFDTEDDQDALAIKEMQISEPSTYFLTGQFVERHEKLVVELAKHHTIGSHSYGHAHLTQLDPVDLRKELLVSKMLLEQVTGSAPRWFRAPFLEYDEQVMNVLKELGFRYDSSDQERWPQQTVLLETPVSTRDNSDQLVSDYDIFLREKMSEPEALEWLKDRYRERAPTGRPLVFLMHPRIIGAHRQVLFDFMGYVREQGGFFLSSDQWVERTFSNKPHKLGVWVDLSLGEHDVRQLVEDIGRSGVTDVFLMARDPEGKDYFLPEGKTAEDGADVFGELVSGLKRTGARVHAWLPAFRNPYLAQLDPRLAMISESGTASLEWISPFHAEVRQSLRDTAAWLLRNYDLQGIHLDYLRYPDLSVDFSPQGLDGFAKAIGSEGITQAQAQTDHYSKWTNWRAKQIAEFTKEMREVVRTFGAQGAELSAALIADAALSYRSTDQFGQDYARLAEHLDLVIPMAYFKEERKPPEWIRQVIAGARFRVGNTSLLAGLAAYQKPGAWSLSKEQLQESIEQARPGSDGVVFYPYLHLFSRGSSDWDMPAGSDEALQSVIASAAPEPTLYTAEIMSNALANGTGVVDRDQPTQGISLANRYQYIVAALVALLGLTWLTLRLRRGRKPTRTCSAPDRTLRAIDVADWAALEKRLQETPVSPETCGSIYNVLRSVGAAGIAAFRGARVLDALYKGPLTIGELLSEMPTARGRPDERYLRYLEECILLGYARMSDDLCQITAAGVERLEFCKAHGYSRRFFRFLETCLGDKLVTCCPICGENNLGHWFWKDVECRACGTDYDISQATGIEVRKPLLAAMPAKALDEHGDNIAVLYPPSDDDSRMSLGQS